MWHCFMLSDSVKDLFYPKTGHQTDGEMYKIDYEALQQKLKLKKQDDQNMDEYIESNEPLKRYLSYKKKQEHI